MKKIGLIGLLVVILIILSFALYWNLNKDKYSGGFFSTLLNIRSSSCRYNDPDLCRFVSKWKEVKGYTETTKFASSDSSNTVQTVKYNGDKSIQLIRVEDGKETKNEIQINNTYYALDYTDNKWLKSETYHLSNNSILNFYSNLTDTKNTTTYNKIGKETCGTEDCIKYQVINSDETRIKNYIYIGIKKYELVKTVNVPDYGSATESTYDFSTVNILQPSPVK